MNTIKVVEFLNNSNLLSSTKANLLYKQMLKYLNNSESLILDFSDYTSISSSFLNSTIGQLIIEKQLDSKEKLFKIVKIIGLSEDDMDNLILTVQNAIFKNNLLSQGQNIEDIYSNYITY